MLMNVHAAEKDDRPTDNTTQTTRPASTLPKTDTASQLNKFGVFLVIVFVVAAILYVIHEICYSAEGSTDSANLSDNIDHA